MQDGEPTEDSQWQYHDDNTAKLGEAQALPAHGDPVVWTASEYISHEKGFGWYASLGALIVVAAALVYVLTKERVSPIVIITIGIAFGVFAARQPDELEYMIDDKGVHVGSRLYLYNQFKTFSIIEEGAIHSIMLMPLHRFMPPLSIYFAPDDEDRIANGLSQYLPYEHRKQDLVDRLMSKIRF